VTVWLWAALGLLISMLPCALICLRGEAVSRLVGLELATTFATLLFICLALGTGRRSFLDVAVATVFLGLGSGLVFARFLERWL